MKMLIVILAIFGTLQAASAAVKPELTVYIYESMGWISEKMAPEFEKRNDCTLKLVKFTDAGSILARLKLEASSPRADVAVGFTQALTLLARKAGLLSAYQSKSLTNLSRDGLVFDADGYATPYDYGSLAFVYDPAKLTNVPKSFREVAAMKRSLLMQDPRISSTGQDFLLWTIAVFGKDWKDFWKTMKSAVLARTPGWDESFAKFEAGEAPMMVSYATDGAYAFQNYGAVKYQAFLPEEGAYIQVEGVSLVKGTKREALAKKFIDFMLSPDFQNEIPLHQWMFPATKVALPECFRYALIPTKTVSLKNAELEGMLEKWLIEWEEIMK